MSETCRERKEDAMSKRAGSGTSKDPAVSKASAVPEHEEPTEQADLHIFLVPVNYLIIVPKDEAGGPAPDSPGDY